MLPTVLHPCPGRSPRAVIVAALAAATCALSACGDDAAAPTERAASASPEQARRAALLRFAGCMREHGVDYPDPRPDGTIVLSEAPGPQGDVAFKACKSYADAIPKPSAAHTKRITDAMLELTRCLREHGANVTDPVADETGDVAFTGTGDLPPAAQRACGELFEKAGLQRPSP